MMLVAIWCLAPVALALLPTQFPLTPPTSDTCLQVPYTPPPPEAGYFASPEFRNLSIHRLTHAVQHATVMYDDMGPPAEDSRWKPFARFHDYLRETYPLV
jgi:Gly-Xaa carboxypeptidase